MRKLEESGKTIVNTKMICDDLSSDDSLACIYALRWCALNDVRDTSVLSIIQALKHSTQIEWNSCKVSDCAIAALHLLGFELYQGNDTKVLELIRTVFYTKIQPLEDTDE